VAPDYILVPRAHQNAAIEAFKKAYRTFWPHPKGALDPLSEMGAILNPHHHTRLMELLRRTQGNIVHGGNTEGTKRIEPTLVADVGLNDSLMEECVLCIPLGCVTNKQLARSELFGPIIPIVPVDDIHEAIQIIRGRSELCWFPCALQLITFISVLSHLLFMSSRTTRKPRTNVCRALRLLLFLIAPLSSP
jgi:aldehyde dehydrogenase (NAD+)